MHPEVIIIGAGAAGLAALASLQCAGIETLCVEARDRIGGRIHTLHDPLSPLPIELGAEFIHGRPPEIWRLAHKAGLPIYDGTDASLHLNNGEVKHRAESWDLVGQILNDMQAAATQPQDLSFEQFLTGTAYPEESKRSARGYIEGFNAADSKRISIQALAEETKASGLIDGDRVFRFVKGYDAVPLHFLHSVPQYQDRLLLNHVVETVSWRPRHIALQVRDALTGCTQKLQARRLIVTVPLGVLQSKPGEEGFIAFDPLPVAILQAAQRLCFGNVFRAILRFREPFWETKPELADAGFILSQQSVFPTWWTTLAIRSSNITGWSAGVKADPLRNHSRTSVLAQAVQSLASITGFPLDTVQAQLENAYFHDWSADPFSRGAYSYVPVGALDARRALAQPVADTLYFAGEATDQQGHSATVHGAIATGLRAAAQIIQGALPASS